jgi:hypothetical protein
MVAERRATGLPLPGGRPKGARNKTAEQRERERCEKETRQALKQIKLQQLADKRARREAKRHEREELAELEHRRQAADRGILFWSDPAGPPPKPVPRGRGKPAWQAHPSHSTQARELERLERTFLGELNAPRHPAQTPLDLGEIEEMYQHIVEYEAVVNTRGRERRLERLRFEVETWRRHMAVDAAIKLAAALTERSSPPGGASPQTAGQTQLENQITPENNQSVPEQSPCAPPDDFRDQLAPSHPVENVDQLKAEIDHRKRRLTAFNLSESEARRLDGELARAQLGRNAADGAAAQLAVLDRWLAGMARAHSRTEAMIGHYARNVEERAARPRPREERPASAAPWLYQR